MMSLRSKFGRRLAVFASLAGGLLGLSLLGCGAKQERIVVASDLPRPTEQEIDADPWKLLPPGAVGFMRVDKQVFSADFGPELSQFLEDYLPFAAGGGIDPSADIDVAVGAAYATVQNDLVFVGQGRFDPKETAAAIASSPQTRTGRPITSVRFAGETMYVVDQAAMAILTAKTIVFGTQLGVRRVLEVVEEDRMHRDLPDWFETLLAQPQAQLFIGVDLDAEAVPAVFLTRLNFLNHLRAARLVGNFKGGGVNLAGALTFDTPQSAQEAEQELNGAEERIDRYRLLMQALKMPSPFRSVRAQSTGKDAQFAVEIEAQAVKYALSQGEAVAQLITAETSSP